MTAVDTMMRNGLAGMALDGCKCLAGSALWHRLDWRCYVCRAVDILQEVRSEEKRQREAGPFLLTLGGHQFLHDFRPEHEAPQWWPIGMMPRSGIAGKPYTFATIAEARAFAARPDSGCDRTDVRVVYEAPYTPRWVTAEVLEP